MPTKNESTGQKPLKRLHKIISAAGVCSLREAERLIAAGQVSVNNEVVTAKGAAADPEKDRISVSGKVIKAIVPKLYLAMNKPKGYVTTKKDEKGRKTVMDLLPKEYRHLNPVGRLDLMSEGLLLFTNDGAFANAVLAPKNVIEKIYHVKTRNIPDRKTLSKMVSGITVDGEKLRAKSANILEAVGKNCWLEMTLIEGKNRQIRRLCETLGCPALKVKRVSIGPIKLGNLKTGESLHLKIEQVNALIKSTGYKNKGR